MGRMHEAKAPILLALGNDGQQRAPVKMGSNPYFPTVSKALNRNTVRGLFRVWESAAFVPVLSRIRS